MSSQSKQTLVGSGERTRCGEREGVKDVEGEEMGRVEEATGEITRRHAMIDNITVNSAEILTRNMNQV